MMGTKATTDNSQGPLKLHHNLVSNNLHHLDQTFAEAVSPRDPLHTEGLCSISLTITQATTLVSTPQDPNRYTGYLCEISPKVLRGTNKVPHDCSHMEGAAVAMEQAERITGEHAAITGEHGATSRELEAKVDRVLEHMQS